MMATTKTEEQQLTDAIVTGARLVQRDDSDTVVVGEEIEIMGRWLRTLLWGERIDRRDRPSMLALLAKYQEEERSW